MKQRNKTYRFYLNENNEIFAVSTYAGKTVRGVAKCSPIDKFSIEDGKQLAAARCNLKISKKRYNRASDKLVEACQAYDQARRQLMKMQAYFDDATDALDEAEAELSEITNKLAPQ